jgi:RNA polymerase sigma factor (sigma-70 family)
MARESLQTVVRHLHRLTAAPGSAGLTDGQLLERWVRQRDEAAFELLAWRHGPLVLGTCRRLLSRAEDVEDAFQATFLALVRKAASIGRRESVAAWLYRVAYRVALAARARARRGTPAAHREPARPDPAEDAAAHELRLVLDEEVARLPEKYRVPFVLCYLQGKTNAEAAAEIGCPHGTLLTRLRWARQRLRCRLARRGVALTAAALAVVLAEASHAPAALVGGAVRAALGTVPGAASALADGVLWEMFQARVRRVAAAVVVAVALLLGGVGVLAQSAGALPPRERPGPVLGNEAARKPATPAEGPAEALPPGAVAWLGTTRLRHGGEVLSVSLGPDDRVIASAGADGVVRLWDVKTGKELRRFEHPAGFTTAAFLDAGKTLAAADAAGTLHVFDPTTGKELRSWKGHEGRVEQIAPAPDGRSFLTLAGWIDPTARLWDAATGKETAGFTSPGFHFTSGNWAADGRTVVTCADDGQGLVWDVATAKTLFQLPFPVVPDLRFREGLRATAALSPDGRTVASLGQDGEITLFTVPEGKKVGQLKPAPGWLTRMEYLPDGSGLVTAGHDGLVRVWDLGTGEEVRQLKGHVGGVRSLAVSATGKLLASGGDDNTVRLWDLATGKELLPFAGPTTPVRSLAFGPHGGLACGTRAGTVFVWANLSTKEPLELRGHSVPVASLDYSPDGKTLVTGGGNINKPEDPYARLWDAEAGKPVRQFGKMIMPGPAAVRFTPGGRLVALEQISNQVRLVEGERTHDLVWQISEDGLLLLSPDGRFAFVGSANSGYQLFDAETGQELHRLPIKEERDPANPFALTRSQGRVVAFSADGHALATAGDGPEVRVWEVITGTERTVLTMGKGADGVAGLAFSPDGRALAVGGRDRHVRLIDLDTGEKVADLAGHQGPVCALAFSRDGRRLASGSEDTSILVWDTAEVLKDPRDGVKDLAAGEADRLWEALGGKDAAEAWRAAARLTGLKAKGVAVIQERLRPAPAEDVEKLKRWAADLDPKTEWRLRSYRELEKAGELPEALLRRARRVEPDETLRNTETHLLFQIGKDGPSPERQRQLRAVEVLERAGDPGREVLEELARGPDGVPLAEDARVALGRVKQRTGE